MRNLYSPTTNQQALDPVTKRKPLHLFALNETRPVFFFDGIWTAWYGTHGSMKTPRAGGMSSSPP